MNKDILRGIVEDLLKRICCEGVVEIKDSETATIVSITSKQSGILIGWHGETLAAFQHLVRTLYSSATSDFGNIVVDINDYRGKQEQILRNLALKAASAAKAKGEAQILRPMSSYERKIVHLTLSGFNDVTTESIGEEPYRKVVIKSKLS
jgi:spoIIIJ-associated protein